MKRIIVLIIIIGIGLNSFSSTSQANKRNILQSYWNEYDFSNKNAINISKVSSNSQKLEKKYVNYIHLLRQTDFIFAKANIESLTLKTKAESSQYKLFLDLARKYLYDSASSVKCEELYRVILKYAIKCNVHQNTIPKERLLFFLCQVNKNRVGSVAADFEFRTTIEISNLYKTMSPYILLFFNDPLCEDCKKVISHLKQSAVINDYIHIGSIKILAISTGEFNDWTKNKSIYPKEWINGFDFKGKIRKKTYDLEQMPTLYLLNADKKVLLKNVTVEEIERYLL